MGDIAKMRVGYSMIQQNCSLSDFLKMVGYPDKLFGTTEDGVLTYESNVWKGIFRGGEVCRRLIICTKNGIITNTSAENLNVSNW